MRAFRKDSKDEEGAKELNKGGLRKRFNSSSTLTNLSAPKSAARAQTMFAKILTRSEVSLWSFLLLQNEYSSKFEKTARYSKCLTKYLGQRSVNPPD